MTTSFKVESCWNKNQIIHKLLIYISRDLYIETRPVRVIEGGQVLALNQIHHYSQFCLIVFSLFIRTTTYLSPDTTEIFSIVTIIINAIMIINTTIIINTIINRPTSPPRTCMFSPPSTRTRLPTSSL